MRTEGKFFLLSAKMLLIVVLIFGLSEFFPQWVSNNSVLTDNFYRFRANSASPKNKPSDVIFISINESFMKSLYYRSPLDRCVLANAIKNISALKPSVIGVDYLYDLPTEPAKDAMYTSIINKLGSKVVVAKMFRKNDGAQVNEMNHLIDTKRFASAALIVEFDGIVRSAERKHLGIQTFAHALAESHGLIEERVSQKKFIIDWLPHRQNGANSLINIPIEFFLDKSSRLKCGQPNLKTVEIPGILKDQIKKRIVVIGSDLEIADRHLTPLDVSINKPPILSGAEIHANIVQQLLDHRRVEKLHPVLTVLLMLCMILFGRLIESRYLSRESGVAEEPDIDDINSIKIIILFSMLYLLVIFVEFICLYYFTFSIPSGLFNLALGLGFVLTFFQIKTRKLFKRRNKANV